MIQSKYKVHKYKGWIKVKVLYRYEMLHNSRKISTWEKNCAIYNIKIIQVNENNFIVYFTFSVVCITTF